MKGFTKRTTLIASMVLIVTALVIAACSFNFIKARAETDKITIIYDENYLSRANTYNAKITEKDVPREKTEKYNSVSYDFSKKNGNIVSDDAPQVTFITHGLGANAANWSNASKGDWAFAYSEGSIFELLQQKADCNLYLATFEKQNSFKLYQINQKDFKDQKEIKKMTDNTKHSIVVFNANKTAQSNDYIYSQFNMMASRVVLELQDLDVNHELPRVNLVGYSRGGLTNLQYALDHPDLVDSIFSLDTPYIGSTSASIDKHILRMYGIAMNDTAGEDDIANPEVYLGYLNRWNNGYDELYSKIKVHALGAYQSLDMLVYQMLYKYIEAIEGTDLDFLIKTLLRIINKFLSLSYGMGQVIVKQSVLYDMVHDIYRTVPGIQNDDSIKSGLMAIFNLLYDELEFNIATLSYDLFNDGLVDLPSQLGKDGQSDNAYKGFKNYVKRFGIHGNYNLTKSSIGDLRVTHNIVARDTELLSYIVKNIEMSCNKNGSPFLVMNTKTETNADGLSIVGYIGKNVNGTLTIPDKIYYEGSTTGEYNKEVLAISDYAFANDMNGELGITQVVISDKVETIGRGAFYNNKNIESVILGKGVKEIYAGAFSDMPKLNRLNLPSSIVQIEERAFERSNISII